nr:PHD finger protein ALFIN-LIKE 4-like isoform X2 [Ipomoea batatas]
MEHFNPRSVEEVFLQFKGRRAALLRALTTDKRKLSLYGHLGERWEVNAAEEVMHAVLPEPLRGINFARDRMEKREWNRLFAMINEHPTILEVVSGKAKPKLVNDDTKLKREWPTPPPPRVCGECNEGYIVGDLWKICLECQRYFHLMKCLKFTKDQHRAPLFVCSSCALKAFSETAAGGSDPQK